jgi:hypothetical protein
MHFNAVIASTSNKIASATNSGRHQSSADICYQQFYWQMIFLFRGDF